jgi:membrane-associated phospholipid phosphatase
VAISFHWFSDVAAGVIVGTVIGRVAGKGGGAVR